MQLRGPTAWYKGNRWPSLLHQRPGLHRQAGPTAARPRPHPPQFGREPGLGRKPRLRAAIRPSRHACSRQHRANRSCSTARPTNVSTSASTCTLGTCAGHAQAEPDRAKRSTRSRMQPPVAVLTVNLGLLQVASGRIARPPSARSPRCGRQRISVASRQGRVDAAGAVPPTRAVPVRLITGRAVRLTHRMDSELRPATIRLAGSSAIVLPGLAHRGWQAPSTVRFRSRGSGW